jgi:hypothetical protein
MKWQKTRVNLVPFFLTSLAWIEKSLSMHPNSQDDMALSLSVATRNVCPINISFIFCWPHSFMMENFVSFKKLVSMAIGYGYDLTTSEIKRERHNMFICHIIKSNQLSPDIISPLHSMSVH